MKAIFMAMGLAGSLHLAAQGMDNSAAPAWKLAEGQHVQTFVAADEATAGARFLLFLPRGYEGRKWPLIVFLHGSGERGSNIDKVKVHGLPNIVPAQPDFPFIVASPQLPSHQDWNPDNLDALIEQLILRLPVDAGRIYLTGLSQGGYGTWDTAAAYPARFAAIAPVSGIGQPDQACRLKNMPIWAFHGALDDVVPLAGDSKMVEQVRACGGTPKFTVYPGVGHNAWSQTYADPDLYRWLLQHRLGSDGRRVVEPPLPGPALSEQPLPGPA